MDGAFIEINGLTRTYRSKGGALVHANVDLDLAVSPGHVFGLLGANGAGKTTMVMQILGLLTPTSGSIRVADVDVVRRPEAVKHIVGFLPQTGLAMRLIEVRRAIAYTGRLRGLTGEAARRQTDELLDELGLGAYADRYVNRLSGGQLRLVNLGMAFIGKPRLLVLDEPTNELDPRSRHMVWDALRRRNEQDGTTVLLVTHNVHEAERAVHRVAVMNHGRIVAEGTPGELKEHLGGHVRLDLRLKEGEALTHAETERLAAFGTLTAGGADGENTCRTTAQNPHRATTQYVIHTEPDRVGTLMDMVVSDVGLKRVDDFRVARPTLEEAYLELEATGGDSLAAPEVPAARRPAEDPPAALRPADIHPAVRRPRGTQVRELIGRRTRELGHLWLEQMLGARTTWVWNVLFGVLMPLAMVFGMTKIGTGLTDRASMLYIISGATVFALTTENVSNLAQRVGMLKAEGTIMYYASLPISKVSFISALMLSRLLLITPGLLTPMVAGALLYDLELAPSPLLLLVLPLSALSLASLGMMIGSLFARVDIIAIVTNILVFALLLIAPVMIPAAALPAPLQVLGWALPPTYAADAVRRSMNGDVGTALTVDLVVLGGMALLGLIVSARWLRWRL
ncbi:ABC transporter ATP-binding protein/permease [Nonomuraea sp. B12E4]|uniref:ABC transporter ATP-binding protein/permease n=1 Tax=Nonomuraea sp. B12E4 TaxID=3153564 RepID=UPI00325E1981